MIDPATAQRPRAAAVAAVLAAMVLVVLDAGIVNVALPSIARSLQVAPGMSVWVVTAYQAALMIGLLPGAALGESQGYRKVFALGVAVFTGASAMCAYSPSLPWLVAARFVQGLGGAAVMSLGVALLRSASLRISVIASTCCFAGTTVGLMALPFYLQHALGLDALATGISMTPWPLAVAMAAPLAGRLADRLPTAWLCAAGGVLLATGLAFASLLPLQGNPQALLLITATCGLGFGLFQVPNNRNLFLSAPEERSGAAGGVQGTARSAGQTAGGVIVSLLFTVAPSGAAPRIGLAMGAVLTLAAGVISIARANPPRQHRNGESTGTTPIGQVLRKG